jgi:hypothetical protein
LPIVTLVGKGVIAGDQRLITDFRIELTGRRTAGAKHDRMEVAADVAG